MSLHGYKNKLVSSFASATGVKTFWEKVVKTDGCWVWNGHRNHKGYGLISVQVGRGAKTRRRVFLLAHRVAMFLSSGYDADGLVLHKCDTKPCVRPDHLYVGTNADNMRDCSLRSHRITRKLSYEDAIAIRRRCMLGHLKKDLAVEYGVTKGAIQQVVSRKTFRHVS